MKTYHFPFLKTSSFLSKITWSFVLVGWIVILFGKGFSLGIDFAGGQELQIEILNQEQDSVLESLKNVFQQEEIDSAAFTPVSTQEGKSVFMARFLKQEDSWTPNNSIWNKVFGENNWKIVSESFVGPSIGKEFQKTAVLAVFLSLILLLLYISFRFEFKFAVAAILALFHDVSTTMLFIFFFQIPIDINVLAAILTIIGYSLNDTIVIFDRIRMKYSVYESEDSTISTKKKVSVVPFIDSSINECLTRTFITSLTTLTVILVLILLGSENLRNMSLVFFWGVVTGTYSSLFIVAPILKLWENDKHKKPAKPASVSHSA